MIEQSITEVVNASIGAKSLNSSTDCLDKATVVGFEQDNILSWLCKTSTGKNIRCSVRSGITMENAVMFLGRSLMLSKVRQVEAEPFTPVGFVDQS